MKDQIQQIKEFNEKFQKLPNNQTLITKEEFNLQYDMLNEENEEYLEACKKNDLVEIADALGDQLYIIFGTILKHGLQYKIVDVVDEIHKSNMSKFDNSGNPIFKSTGKLDKGPNYFKPNLKDIIDG